MNFWNMSILFFSVHHDANKKLLQLGWRQRNVSRHPSVSFLRHGRASGCEIRPELFLSNGITAAAAVTPDLCTSRNLPAAAAPWEGASYSEGENSRHRRHTVTETYSQWQEIAWFSLSITVPAHCIPEGQVHEQIDTKSKDGGNWRWSWYSHSRQ